jgi:hypothetical protein
MCGCEGRGRREYSLRPQLTVLLRRGDQTPRDAAVATGAGRERVALAQRDLRVTAGGPVDPRLLTLRPRGRHLISSLHEPLRGTEQALAREAVHRYPAGGSGVRACKVRDAP